MRQPKIPGDIKFKYIKGLYFPTELVGHKYKVLDLRAAKNFPDWDEFVTSIQEDYVHHVMNEEGWALFSEEVIAENKDILPYGTYKYGEDTYGAPFLSPSSIREEKKHVSLNLLQPVEKDIASFLKSKHVYDELQIPYRRGYLLHGPPGNGKTSLVRDLVSKHLNDTYVIFTNTVPKDQILQALNNTPGNKIVIFEELVNKRSLDMNDFLTFMDGELSLNDCITIATTNYVQDLKENVANRPSRFDLVVKVDNPKAEDAVKIAERYLDRIIEREEGLFFSKKEFSIAQIKEIALLTKLHSISLFEAVKKVKSQSEAFHQGFEDKKTFGVIS